MKNKCKKIIPGVLLFSIIFQFTISSVYAAKIVSNKEDLESIIKEVKQGEEIILKDGIWHEVQLNLKKGGTEQAPILIKAETPGKVFFTGESYLIFSAPNIIVDGITFTNGMLRDGIAVVNFNSDHCKLTNSAVINYNPNNFKTSYYWIFINGSYNHISSSYFEGKNNMGPLIGNADKGAKFNRVTFCHFKDIPYIKGANGREILRIWGYGHNDEYGIDGSFFTIEYNLFENAHGEGTEIISLKSNHNIVRCNTIISSRGGIVSRRGNNNLISDNIIIGNKFEGTTGIRIAGQNHRVINNYIENVAEDGIRLITGEYTHPLTDKYKIFKVRGEKGTLPKYNQVKNCVICNNTLYKCQGKGIYIGYAYKDNWPIQQMVLLPENNLIFNNNIKNNNDISIYNEKPDESSILKRFSFKQNIIDNKKETPTIKEFKCLSRSDVGPIWMHE